MLYSTPKDLFEISTADDDDVVSPTNSRSSIDNKQGKQQRNAFEAVIISDYVLKVLYSETNKSMEFRSCKSSASSPIKYIEPIRDSANSIQRRGCVANVAAAYFLAVFLVVAFLAVFLAAGFLVAVFLVVFLVVVFLVVAFFFGACNGQLIVDRVSLAQLKPNHTNIH